MAKFKEGVESWLMFLNGGTYYTSFTYVSVIKNMPVNRDFDEYFA